MEFLVKNKNYIGFGGCVLTCVGCFLPYVSSLGMSLSYIEGDGKILVVAMVITAVLIYLKKDKFSLISSCIGAALFLYSAINVLTTSGINLGIGAIFIFVGLVGAIAYPFLNQKN